MEDLAERDAAERRVDEVVQRRLVGLAEVLPRAAAERCDRRRLPEVQAVRARAREVVVALIRVAELIDDEVVEIPDPAMLHVVPPRGGRDARGDLSTGEIRQSVDDIDVRGLQQRVTGPAPRAAVAGAAL